MIFDGSHRYPSNINDIRLESMIYLLTIIIGILMIIIVFVAIIIIIIIHMISILNIAR